MTPAAHPGARLAALAVEGAVTGGAVQLAGPLVRAGERPGALARRRATA